MVVHHCPTTYRMFTVDVHAWRVIPRWTGTKLPTVRRPLMTIVAVTRLRRHPVKLFTAAHRDPGNFDLTTFLDVSCSPNRRPTAGNPRQANVTFGFIEADDRVGPFPENVVTHVVDDNCQVTDLSAGHVYNPTLRLVTWLTVTGKLCRSAVTLAALLADGYEVTDADVHDLNLPTPSQLTSTWTEILQLKVQNHRRLAELLRVNLPNLPMKGVTT